MVAAKDVQRVLDAIALVAAFDHPRVDQRAELTQGGGMGGIGRQVAHLVGVGREI